MPNYSPEITQEAPRPNRGPENFAVHENRQAGPAKRARFDIASMYFQPEVMAVSRLVDSQLSDMQRLTRARAKFTEITGVTAVESDEKLHFDVLQQQMDRINHHFAG